MEATAAPTAVSAALDQLCVNTIRTLAMDGVQRANSGHPGTPMALAPLGHRLFSRHMRHDPADPAWPDRDRFILSCGHASMLLYSLLHLSGYDVPLEALRQFRQLHSHTAGHPELGDLPGVEYTTGPLGQGMAAAVGMALAERMLAEQFNRRGHTVVDHRTWVIASDGDLMEGVSAEASSLAGHLGLGRLTVFWDDNSITIDGATGLAFSEDVGARYAAYGWQVLHLDEVDDLDAIDRVVDEAAADSRPTLVVTRTRIGIGSPREGTSKAHGEPLGEDNVRLTKEAYGWPADEQFLVPDEVREAWHPVAERGAERSAAWRDGLEGYRRDHPELCDELERRLRRGDLPGGWDAALSAHRFEPGTRLATRKASQVAIGLLAPHVPELVGGSADLAASNLTAITDGGDVAPASFGGRNIHYGIREHAMAAITNGMLAHGGVRPFAGTFLIFSDYMRPALRLAALSRLPAIYVFTHDSVHLGEDGPTHQPIEQLASLRAMPNLLVLRPADAAETLQAWQVALRQHDRPVALALTRQSLGLLSDVAGTTGRPQVERGAWTVREASSRRPELILVATGSEVHLALEAAEELEAGDIPTRVVSMPSQELFLAQDHAWREQVLPRDVRARVAVEAGSSFGWERFVGDVGEVVGIDRFGLSAPGAQAAEALGLSIAGVVAAAHRSLATLHGEG